MIDHKFLAVYRSQNDLNKLVTDAIDPLTYGYYREINHALDEVLAPVVDLIHDNLYVQVGDDDV